MQFIKVKNSFKMKLYGIYYHKLIIVHSQIVYIILLVIFKYQSVLRIFKRMKKYLSHIAIPHQQININKHCKCIRFRQIKKQNIKLKTGKMIPNLKYFINQSETQRECSFFRKSINNQKINLRKSIHLNMWKFILKLV